MVLLPLLLLLLLLSECASRLSENKDAGQEGARSRQIKHPPVKNLALGFVLFFCLNPEQVSPEGATLLGPIARVHRVGAYSETNVLLIREPHCWCTVAPKES